MSWHAYKILAHRDKIEAIKRGEWIIPLYAVLQLSFACNQNCKSCAFAEWNKSNFIPDRIDAFKIVDRLIDYGIMNFELSGGGEPTTLPYFNDLLKHILERGANFALLTNGYNLDDEAINLIAKNAIFCRISLETGDMNLYSRYKRVPHFMFSEVIGNIKKLLKSKSPDTEISLKFDVDKNLNYEQHIKASFDLACQLGVDLASFKSMTGETELSDSEKIEAEYLLNKLIKDNHSKVKFINSIFYNRDVPKCWLNQLHTVIDGRGNVYLCCYYYRDDAHKREDMCIGNILDKPFKDIWETDEHKNKIAGINPVNCAKFDCKYFSHHRIVNEAFKKGRMEIV